MFLFAAVGAVAFGVMAGLQPAYSQSRYAPIVVEDAAQLRAASSLDPDASLPDLAAQYLDHQDYRPEHVESLTVAIEDELSPTSSERVFPAHGQLGPLTKAILSLEAREGILPRVRYRLRYGMMMVDAPPAADPVPVSFVQVDRFNLGPVIRDELVGALGADNVASAAAFGEGPHVSYRLVMQPIMGHTADIVAAARMEISPREAKGMNCLGLSCGTTESVAEAATEWEGMDALDLAFAPPYPIDRQGLITPAAAIDMLALELGVARADDGRVRWTGFEPRESLAGAKPFVVAVIEIGLGQDDVLDAVMREGEVMDHSVLAVWQRIIGLPQAGAGPAIYGASAFEHRTEQN